MPPARFAFCREVLESEDANAIRVAAAWDDPVDSTREFDANGYPVKIPLGKALLLETSAQWFGTFDLDDAETMAIYRHYAGKPSS
jgi:hypothetical protein